MTSVPTSRPALLLSAPLSFVVAAASRFRSAPRLFSFVVIRAILAWFLAIRSLITLRFAALSFEPRDFRSRWSLSTLLSSPSTPFRSLAALTVVSV